MQIILRNKSGCELGRYHIPGQAGTGPADLFNAALQNNELSSVLSYLEPGDTLTISED